MERGEQGFMLVGLIVAIFLILLALSVAAPKVAQDLRREREVEAVHRGNQYVRAIQLYYRKFGHYPGSIEQLEKTNNVRFLRQQYVDPMTGKVDWRLIKVGEAKTTVKGFFGQPLAGLTPGVGSAAGTASRGTAGAAVGLLVLRVCSGVPCLPGLLVLLGWLVIGGAVGSSTPAFTLGGCRRLGGSTFGASGTGSAVGVRPAVGLGLGSGNSSDRVGERDWVFVVGVVALAARRLSGLGW